MRNDINRADLEELGRRVDTGTDRGDGRRRPGPRDGRISHYETNS
jgi:hypothetical protein